MNKFKATNVDRLKYKTDLYEIVDFVILNNIIIKNRFGDINICLSNKYFDELKSMSSLGLEIKNSLTSEDRINIYFRNKDTFKLAHNAKIGKMLSDIFDVVACYKIKETF